MDFNPLQSILVGESRAYGFTIAFWGSGALLISSFGVPGIQNVMLYALGALSGFGLVALIAFSSFFETAGEPDSEYLVLSMIHYIASLGPIMVTYFLTQADPGVAFFFAGASVSVVYNLLQLVEEFVSEEFKRFEERLIS